MELGHLIKSEFGYIHPDRLYELRADKRKADANSGHHFNNGDKVELDVEISESFSFDSYYGRQFIQVFIDKENRLFKYVGGSPIEKFEGYKKIKATIKHSTYNDQPETKLLRIKIL